MRIEAGGLVLITALIGCRVDPEHPTGAAAVPFVDGAVVATVDGRKISDAEARQYAATHDDPTVDGLVEREERVGDALEQGLDVEFERKRAMVQALLADEIEGKVTAADVPPALLKEVKEKTAYELRGWSGFEVTAVRVASLDLLAKRAKLSDARIAELEAQVAQAAQRLQDEVPEHGALDAVHDIDRSWLDPGLRAEVRDIKVLDASELRDPPKGWVRSRQLAQALTQLQDGDRTPMLTGGGIPMFAVRRARIEAAPTDAAKVDELAERRALGKVRRDRLDGLLADLRAETPVTVHTKLLEEEGQ